jgi:cell division protein FtsN
MEIVSNEKADKLKYFALQAGAFSSVVNANELKSQLNELSFLAGKYGVRKWA